MKLSKKQKKQSANSWLRKTLEHGTDGEVRALFAFDNTDSDETVLFRFRLWSRWFFPKFFHFKDAAFHLEIDRRNLRIYRGSDPLFTNIAFRNAAKTTRTKLFFAFCVANDLDHFRRYFKVLSADYGNARQNVTDIYNLLVAPRITALYPELFQKHGKVKREESMASFTTSTGVKIKADSVGTDQRGDIQEDARPDVLWFDDFETRKILRSAVTLQAIWDNMEEARNGLSKNGSALYTCNYLSERGNVHKLVTKYPKHTLITPIKGAIVNAVHVDGPPTWPEAYTPKEVETKLANTEDPAGEYLCVPSAGADIFFDRSSLEKQELKAPVRTIADFKIFHPYDPSHRYASAHDVSGGVSLDSSTSVFIDFSTIPNRVVATFRSNTIKPDVFGYEIIRQCDIFGQPLCAPENNKFDMTIGVLKHQGYPNIFFTEVKETRAGLPPRTRYYGWNTNTMTRPKMLYELKKAVEDGHLELSDPDLVAELRSFTRDDLMDSEDDPRLTTRHFDLLFACAIAWQMRNYATVSNTKTSQDYKQPEYEQPTL